MPCTDREKRLKICKNWREKNKEKLKQEYQINKNGIKSYKKLIYNKKRLSYIEEKLQLKCQECDENHIACLEFYHLDPKEKEENISKMVKYSLKRIEKEKNKCIILCSNCHRKLHWDNDRVNKLKNKIKDLEIECKEFDYKRIKKCRKCDKENVKFVKGRSFCKECYKIYQKEKMRERRKLD